MAHLGHVDVLCGGLRVDPGRGAADGGLGDLQHYGAHPHALAYPLVLGPRLRLVEHNVGPACAPGRGVLTRRNW
eukprot:5936756-Pyramimonas_sp.AAC.1